MLKGSEAAGPRFQLKFNEDVGNGVDPVPARSAVGQIGPVSQSGVLEKGAEIYRGPKGAVGGESVGEAAAVGHAVYHYGGESERHRAADPRSIPANPIDKVLRGYDIGIGESIGSVLVKEMTRLKGEVERIAGQKRYPVVRSPKADLALVRIIAGPRHAIVARVQETRLKARRRGSISHQLIKWLLAGRPAVLMIGRMEKWFEYTEIQESI